MSVLLLIDDDRDVLEINSANFKDKGYRVFTAENADSGLGLFYQINPDCIVLDIMLPDNNGFEICKEIRKSSSVPIIFLTGKISEDDKLRGFALGGDDYVEKPFSFRELEARVNTSIRRSISLSANTLLFPPLELDIIRHCAYNNGEDLYLTQQEYDLLYLLICSQGKTVTYEEIGLHMWGSYHQENRSAIMVKISRLRKKLDANPQISRMIETVWSTGYRFIGKKAT